MAATAERRGIGLSAKLLMLTVLFVMLAEVLIFVPSIANFRITWLTDRLTAAQLAALAAEAMPDGAVPPTLRAELLRTAQVRAVALKRQNERRLVLPFGRTRRVRRELRLPRGRPRCRSLGWPEIAPAPDPPGPCGVYANEDRLIRVIGETGMGPGELQHR